MQPGHQSVVATDAIQPIPWAKLQRKSRIAVGLLNGLGGFFVATIFSWDRETWQPGLIVPLASCIIASLAITLLPAGRSWQHKLAMALTIGLAIVLALSFSGLTTVATDAVSAFSVLLSVALTLPYQLKHDVGEGCVLNLRIYSAIALLGIVAYVLNPSKAPLNVGFTFVMSFGLLLGQLAFARHMQALASKLSQESLLYTGAGVLTLAALFSSVGPLVSLLVIFVACAILALIFMPLLLPVMQWLYNKISHLPSRHTTRSPSTTNTTGPSHLAQHAQATTTATHWIAWGMIYAILFALALFFLLRRRAAKPAEETQAADAIAPVVIKRDRQIDSFQLQQTDNPIRQRYQHRLKQWHQRGYTIGRSESPHELLRRLPAEEWQDTDERLTAAYEETRYGPSTAHRQDD